ncbi:MAG: hypothetical protein AB2A00_09755 [Myxococcota bacterium]
MPTRFMLTTMALQKRLLLLATTLATSAFSLSAPPTLSELARGSSHICTGTVTAQRTGWDARRQLILTTTELHVDRCVKGAGPRITITEVGGTVEGTTLNNPGQAHYREGQSYLVFLTSRETGGLRTYHGPLGNVPVRDVGNSRQLTRPVVLEGRELRSVDEVLQAAELLTERAR